MKKSLLVLTLVVAVGSLLSLMNVQAESGGEKGFVIGDAIEVSTLVMKGGGADNVAAMVSRTEQGFPVGIIEEDTGKLWICTYRNNAPASGMLPGNDVMKAFMGKKVVAQGLKFSVKGINVIRFGNMSEY